jgi:hypothetical protein
MNRTRMAVPILAAAGVLAVGGSSACNHFFGPGGRPPQ